MEEKEESRKSEFRAETKVIMEYLTEHWDRYGKSVPVSYSSMMRRLPGRLRDRDLVLGVLKELDHLGFVSFTHSYLAANVIYHPDHAENLSEP